MKKIDLIRKVYSRLNEEMVLKVCLNERIKKNLKKFTNKELKDFIFNLDENIFFLKDAFITEKQHEK